MRALDRFIVKSTAGGFQQEIELVVNFCPLCPHTASSGGKCKSFHAGLILKSRETVMGFFPV